MENLIFTQLSKKELSKLVFEMVQKAIEKSNSYRAGKEQESKLLSLSEISEYFDVCKSTVHNWRKKGFLPAPIRKGRRVYFRRVDIENALKKDQHK